VAEVNVANFNHLKVITHNCSSACDGVIPRKKPSDDRIQAHWTRGKTSFSVGERVEKILQDAHVILNWKPLDSTIQATFESACADLALKEKTLVCATFYFFLSV
jgi:hypothetical protein